MTMIPASPSRRLRMFPAFVSLITLTSLSGCAGHCNTGNESKHVLREVTCPLRDPVDDGHRFRHETFSIEGDEFVLLQSLEREVGSIGVSLSVLDAKHAVRAGAEPYRGVLVRGVRKDGPADRAELEAGDVILSFGEEPIGGRPRLLYLIENAPPGERIEVRYMRGGEERVTSVEIDGSTRIDRTRRLARTVPILDDSARAGMQVAELPEDIRRYVFATTGDALLITDVLPGGPAYFSELRVGDAITHMGGEPVRSLAEYESALARFSSGDEVSIAARRKSQALETVIEIAENATERSGFNFLNLVAYQSKPEKREFSLLWELLYHSSDCHSVEEKDGRAEHRSYKDWGFLLNLVHYNSSETATRLRLFWILPIVVRHS